MQRVLALLTTVAALQGCAVEPPQTVEPADAAELRSQSTQRAPYHWEGYQILAVDDRFIGGDGFDAVVSAAPGPHEVVVYVRFNRGRGTGPFDAQVPLKVDLAPATSYRVAGRVAGPRVEVWLENLQTGERAAGQVASLWRKAPDGIAVPPFNIPSY